MNHKTIIELDSTAAREYLLQPSSYCTINLPDYYDFTRVLSFVEEKIGSRDLSACLSGKVCPSAYEGVNHQLLVNKDGRFAFRRLQLANPYLYYLLVRIMTENDNWELIQHHFENRSRPNISVASLPKERIAIKQAQSGVDIPTWWENYEQESIALALRYQYVFITDISDCYGSIYTHTIPWSLYGKEYAKEHRGEGNLGNTIDRYMSAMNYNQTNGIPQGSVLFDLIAEIVLAYADSCLYDRLALRGFRDDDYSILRYRDDYRIFGNRRDLIEVIIRELQNVLGDLNFIINSFKTHLSEDVVLDSIKDDKLAFIYKAPFYSKEWIHSMSIQKVLLFILKFSKDYPNCGVVARLLSDLLSCIDEVEFEKENLRVLISITVDIMLNSPRVFNVGTALVSSFLSKLDEGKNEVIKSLYAKLRRLANTGELEIWLQRITYHIDDVGIQYEEPLTKLVLGDTNVKLWNNDWIKPELFAGFPYQSICNKVIRDSQTPVILAKEVSLFQY